MPVVDASVVVDWVAPDADSGGPAVALLDSWARSGATVVAPRLMLEEVANALLTGMRGGRWDGVAADRAFDQLTRLPVSLYHDDDLLERGWNLGRRYDNHPVYDMVYLALAEHLTEKLYTADHAFVRRLVRHDLVVPIG